MVSFLKPPPHPHRLLGCFSDAKKLGPTGVFPSNAQPFQRLLEDEAAAGGCAGDNVCPTLKHCSKLFIYLYKMATDSFDRSVDGKKQREQFGVQLKMSRRKQMRLGGFFLHVGSQVIEQHLK